MSDKFKLTEEKCKVVWNLFDQHLIQEGLDPDQRREAYRYAMVILEFTMFTGPSITTNPISPALYSGLAAVSRLLQEMKKDASK